MWARLRSAMVLIEGLEVALKSGRVTQASWEKLEQAEAPSAAVGFVGFKGHGGATQADPHRSVSHHFAHPANPTGFFTFCGATRLCVPIFLLLFWLFLFVVYKLVPWTSQ